MFLVVAAEEHQLHIVGLGPSRDDPVPPPGFI